MSIANFPQRTKNGYALDGLETVGFPPRESQVFLLLAKGKSRAEAAQILNCSVSNIRHRVDSLLVKLHANNTTDLMIKAVVSGKLRLLCLMLAIHLGSTAYFIQEPTEIIARNQRTQRTRSRTGNSRTRRGTLLWDPETNELITA